MKTKRKLVPISTVDCGTQGPGNGNVGLQNRGPGNGDVRLENLNVDIGSSKRWCIQHQSVSQIGQPSNAIHNRERVEVLSNTNVNVPELQTSLGVLQRRQLPLFNIESNSHTGSVCRLPQRLFTVLPWGPPRYR
ncbi:hypothetical protein Tco_0389366 [Tanacetum coccineum]